MSKEYRQQITLERESSVEALLSDSPFYLGAFYEHIHHGKREMATQITYIRDIKNFLIYLTEVIPELKDKELKNIPLEVIDKLVLQDINDYRDYLFKEKKLSNSTAARTLSSISAFFKFLCLDDSIATNPMSNFEFPAINKHRIVKLDAELSNRLLEGILRNDKFLIESENGDFVVDILPEIRIRRERTVLRNYAITYLFLGAGLRVSELVGLDLDDISFTNNCVNVILKGGDETQVYFSDEVAEALKLYLNGTPLPSELSAIYSPVSKEAEWAKKHISDMNLDKSIAKDFPNMTTEEKCTLTKLVSHYRRQGRDNFKPARN